MSVRDVIIVGAGPSGLSAAIACKQRGLDYVVIEQGVLVNSIYRFPPQMVFFTTPELLEIGGLPLTSPFDKPRRAEALNYYRARRRRLRFADLLRREGDRDRRGGKGRGREGQEGLEGQEGQEGWKRKSRRGCLPSRR